MPFLKYLDLMQRMDQMIRMKATGRPEEFARKMNVSRSMLMNYLAQMREMGAPIGYSKYRNCYYYTEDVEFDPTFRKRSL